MRRIRLFFLDLRQKDRHQGFLTLFAREGLDAQIHHLVNVPVAHADVVETQGFVFPKDLLHSGGKGNGQVPGRHLSQIVGRPTRRQFEKPLGFSDDVQHLHLLVDHYGQRQLVPQSFQKTLQDLFIPPSEVPAAHPPGAIHRACVRNMHQFFSRTFDAAPGTENFVLLVQVLEVIAHVAHGFAGSQEQQAIQVEGEIEKF